jgi:hypothetical protein
MIVCVKIPSLELRAAFGRRWRGQERPGALVVDGPGGLRVLGEISEAARAHGIRQGMDVGGALELCPGLMLAESDPVGAASISEDLFSRLEEFGAELEIGLPGEAFFRAEGLMPMYGGRTSFLKRLCELIGGEAGAGMGPTRLAALAALAPPGSTPTPVSHEESWDRLGSLSIECMANRLEGNPADEKKMWISLERMGISRLGQLRELGRDALSDRFGEIGLAAFEMAAGNESALQSRVPVRPIRASVDLWEQAGTESLHRALLLLSSKVSDSLVRLGKTARSLLFQAELAAGGSWQRSFVPRRPTHSERLITAILSPALELLPGPPICMRLEVRSFAEPEPEQTVILPDPEFRRRGRLDRAARQVQEVLGGPVLMKVTDAEPQSPIPERRLMLVPHIPGRVQH